jgi:nucleosome binding factor SPN SPT16 subunit
MITKKETNRKRVSEGNKTKTKNEQNPNTVICNSDARTRKRKKRKKSVVEIKNELLRYQPGWY